ncbi:MAG TPA: hypothetical protein VMH87_05025 [Pseudomonadales bacterium]|nr:hypothetical protein [Pseudomonadales bacterium]
MKKLLACSLLAALALASGCNKSQSSAASAGDDSDGSSKGDLIAKIDKHGDEIMASSTKGEAREWMKQPKHIFFKADPKVVAQFVEDFYQAGATQVYIADIEEEEGNQYGESLLIVLPTDPAARAKLFQVEARADTQFEDDPVTDQGQKYLYNGLD